ncbi:hypothetical protein DL93DRAFT_516493 [Clavulina sp. PMI_390]|nr:hypothetical protein DL93DRAFT_516493 [Clavulina sp. PMI_390]
MVQLLSTPKLVFLAAVCASFAAKTVAVDGSQAPLSIPDSCVDDCAALGCNADGSAATPTVVDGSIIVPVPATGPPPFTAPAGLEGATQVGNFVGPDGKTTVSWKLSQPSTIYVPGSAPTDPPCASWTISTATKTDVINGQTFIREEPVLTAVGGQSAVTTKTETTTSTETITLPPVTLPPITLPPVTLPPETITQISIPPPETITHISVPPPETITLPPVTQISVETTTTTTTTTETSIPPPQIITSISVPPAETVTHISVPPPETITLPPVTQISVTTETKTETSIPPPETITLPPVTQISVTTETKTETSVPPPETITLPPVTHISVSTETTTSTTTETSIPPPQIITSVSVSTTTTTETSIPPPETITLPPITQISVTTETTTSVSTTTSIPPPVTQISVTTETTTSIPPAQTVTLPPVTQVSVSTSTTTVTSVPPPVISVSTTTSVTTQSVSYCPPPVTTAPAVPCVPGIVTDWTNILIAKGAPFSVNWNDPYPAKLRVQDTGKKTEKYNVAVDGGQVGATSDVTKDAGSNCGATPASQKTCQAQGNSYGEFSIPAGNHAVTITNIPGYYDDNAAKDSTVLYQFERICAGTYVPPKPACSADVQTAWTAITVQEGKNYALPAFNYNYPVKLTLVDGGYLTEKVSYRLDPAQ